MKSTIRLVFDFDGPLANSKPLLLEYASIALQTDYDNCLQDMIDHFMEPRHCINTVLTQEQYDQTRSWIMGFTEFMFNKTGSVAVPLFDQFIAEIVKLEQKQFGVITSGLTEYVIPSLSQYSDTFTQVLCFDTHPSKVYKMEQLEKLMGYDENTNIVYITDTLSDVLEFEEYLGLDNIYGVSWGVHPAEILATKLGDKNILHNFEDLHKIFM